MDWFNTGIYDSILDPLFNGEMIMSKIHKDLCGKPWFKDFMNEVEYKIVIKSMEKIGLLEIIEPL